jgi:oxygen-independent coproporphyrinogen-3 oxidase
MTKDWEGELATLIEGGAIPPFVYCYPVRSAYRDLDPALTRDAIWSADLDHSPSRDLNVYLHVPFCRYKCGFCNLYTVISEDEDVYDAYVDALCTDLRAHAEIIRTRRLRTFYIGGGTPSLLHQRHFEQLFETLGEIYPNWRTTVDEVAIEASPDSIVDDPGVVERLMRLGLTRANVGIQSLRPGEIRQAGRQRANEEVVRRAIAIVKDAGLPNLSTDLIMGFAGQTDDSWRQSVDELIALDPETISTYTLTVRPDAWFSKIGRYEYLRDPALHGRYRYAQDALLDAGYVQDSNVRYKRPGRGGYLQKVNQFRGVPVLGIGGGARTYTNTVDYLVGGSSEPHLSQVRHYVDAVRAGVSVPERGFVYDDEERIRKRLVLDNFDLDLGDLESYGYSRRAHLFEPILTAAENLGLTRRITPSRLQLTKRGFQYRDILSWRLFSDEVVRRDRKFYSDLHGVNNRARAAMGTPVYVSGLAVRPR